MAMSREEVQVLLTARSNLSPVIGRAVASLKRLKSGVGGITQSLGRMTAVVGGINALSLTAIGAAGIKVGSDFNASAALLEESGERIQQTFLDIKAFNPQVEIDNLSEGLRTLSERFSEARQGSGDAADALKRVGADLSIDGVLNQLEEVRSKFADIETVSERIELANILFGDEDARQVLSYLKATEDQIDRVRKARERLGLVVPQEALDNIKEARAAMSVIQNVFSQFAVTVAGQVTPLITEAAAKFLAFVEANGGVVQFVDSVYDNIKAKTQSFFATVLGVANTIRKVYLKLSGDLDAATLDELQKIRAKKQDAFDGASRVGLFPKVIERRASQLKEVDDAIKAIEDRQNSLKSATDASTESWVEYFNAQTSAALSGMQLNSSIKGTGDALTIQSSSVNAAASVIEAAVKRINSLDIAGFGDLDLSGAQLARQGLNDLQAAELASIFGLEISDAKKQELAQELKERIGTLNVRLKVRAELAIEDALDGEQITNLMDAYSAQLGRDDAVQIPGAIDALKGTSKEVKTLEQNLRSLGQGFDSMAAGTQASGMKMFESFKRTGAAIAAVAALVAAVNAAKAASFSANPLAAIGAYLTVGGTLLGAVASIGGISPGNTPTSVPGGGGGSIGSTGTAPTGPSGGTQEQTEETGGDVFNINIQGEDSDKITLGQFRNFVNLLRRNESERRSFQTVLSN